MKEKNELEENWDEMFAALQKLKEELEAEFRRKAFRTLLSSIREQYLRRDPTFDSAPRSDSRFIHGTEM